MERKIQLTLTPNQPQNEEVNSVNENMPKIVSKISNSVSTVRQDVNNDKKRSKGIGV